LDAFVKQKFPQAANRKSKKSQLKQSISAGSCEFEAGEFSIEIPKKTLAFSLNICYYVTGENNAPTSFLLSRAMFYLQGIAHMNAE